MNNLRIEKTVCNCIILILKLIIIHNWGCAQNLKANIQSLPIPIVYDQNWNYAPIFSDDFASPNRYWLNNRTDNEGKWRAYFHESGVTHGYPNTEHQIYQIENTLFNIPTTGFLTLRATYHNPCVTSYWYPSWCPETGCFNYISGAIESINPFKYGYFEIRAKLPQPNCGNFPAFWLYSGKNVGNRYSEIDICEHIITPEYWIPLTYKRYKCNFHDSDGIPWPEIQYYLQDSESPLTEFHTYAIEWSPKIIVFYFDGKVIGQAFYEPEITDQVMFIKVNFAIDDWKNNACNNTSLFPLDMVIDYVKVYKLNCDCSTPVTITNNTELISHSKSVKEKITVGTSSGIITVPSTGIVLRATDEIIINNNFEVPLGSEFSAIVHDCPE